MKVKRFPIGIEHDEEMLWILFSSDVEQLKGDAVRLFAPVWLMQAHAVPHDVRTAGFGPVGAIAVEFALLAKTQQAGDKAKERLLLIYLLPIEPTDLIVLAVGVVVAALGAAHLIAHEHHRSPLREQQDGEEIADLATAQRVDAGSSVGPSAPKFQLSFWLLPSRLSSPLASLCLSL